MLTDNFLTKWDPHMCYENYGNRMYDSALADWVEFIALRKLSEPWNTVIDILSDMGIDKEYRPIRTSTEEEHPELHSQDLDERMRSLIEKRSVYLKEAYPFEFDGLDRLVRKQNFDFHADSYVTLLLISLLMGWGPIAVTDTATKLFEHVIDAALKGANISSAIIGTSCTGHSFEGKLQLAGEELNIPTSVTGVDRSKYAKDCGVDVVAGYLWNDGRKAEQLFLIQAACGKAESWKTKLNNIDQAQWKDFFLERTMPISSLAVPYQLTYDVINDVLPLAGNTTFLDRLRLAKACDGQSIDEFLSVEGEEYLTQLYYYAANEMGICLCESS